MVNLPQKQIGCGADEKERLSHMRIYGLDFTSAPTHKSVNGGKAKWLTLAKCRLSFPQGPLPQLLVEELVKLNVEAPLPLFYEVRRWLDGKYDGSNETAWVAGIDFPFGMPVAAVEHFQWLAGGVSQTWESYISRIYQNCVSIEQFQEMPETWRKESRPKAGKSSKEERVFLPRLADKIGGFGGAQPSSPMKVNPQCNPPVGRMFYEGARLLQAANVSIYPVRINSSKRVVVEAYPRLVADHCIGSGEKYKDGKGLDELRENIIDKLGNANNPYKLKVVFEGGSNGLRQQCIRDEKGDTLDSVL